MNFYDFLWSSVRKPKLIVEYARQVGVDAEIDENADFYERLRQVAILSVKILRAEMSQLDVEIPQAEERCREVVRFVLEALQDLKEAGKDVEGIEAPRC